MNRGDKNNEQDLTLGSAAVMNSRKFLVKALRMAAAVLTMVAQIILACMG
jgi:hypothetical protein